MIYKFKIKNKKKRLLQNMKYRIYIKNNNKVNNSFYL